MAYSVTYTCPSDGTNHSIPVGASREFTFTQSSGTVPPASAVVTSVQVVFSKIAVWSQSSPYVSIGSMGNFALTYTGNSTNSQSGYLTNLNAGAALAFAINGGGLVFTAHSTSHDGDDCLSVRASCAITVTIVYDVTSASTGSLNLSSVMLGRGITMTIEPADPTFTHTLLWQSAAGITESQSVQLAAGVTTCTFTIPSNWTTGQAKVFLWTLNQGNYVGGNTYAFNITVDGSQVFPTTGTLGITHYRASNVVSSIQWPEYIQGIDFVKLSLNSATPGNQATFQQVALACGSQSQITASTLEFTTSWLDETGNVQCTGSVTNSFGNSASATPVTITVYPYADSQIGTVRAYRCVGANDSTPDENGAYLAVSVMASCSSVNGKNSLASLTAQYKKATASAWSTGVAVANGGSITIIGGDLSGQDTYSVRIVAVDQIQSAKNTYSEKIVTALLADSIIHVLNGGKNVSIGMEGSRQNALEITEDWDIYHGNVKISGTVPVDRGGTGATSASGARTNLGITPSAIGAAAASHTHGQADITGQIPITKGGTGADTAASARANLGVAAETHTHAASDINSGTLAAARLPFKYAYGTAQINQNWTTIALTSVGFTTDPVILCTYTDDAATSGINVIKTRNVSTASFDVCTAGSSNTLRYICWFAFGV